MKCQEARELLWHMLDKIVRAHKEGEDLEPYITQARMLLEETAEAPASDGDGLDLPSIFA